MVADSTVIFVILFSASVPILLQFPSQAICGLLMSKYGRKYLFCFGFLALLSANLVTYFATNYNTLLIGLTLIGAAGGPLAIGALYTAEYSSPKYRGSLVTSKAPAGCVSIIICHFLGIHLHWKTIAALGAIPSIIGLAILLFSPESPAWLASRGKFDECEKAYRWYRENKEDEELDQMIRSQKKAISSKTKNISNKEFDVRAFIKFLCEKGFLRACAIGVACTVFVDGSGKQIFNMLAIDIITKIVGSDTDVFYYALAMDLCDLVATTLSCYLVMKFKRRTLLFKMAIPAILLLLLFCLLSFLNSRGYIPKSLSWLTLVVIALYFFIISACATPVAYAFMVEVCPLSHRGAGMIINGFLFYTFLFIFTKMTPNLLRNYEAHGAFMINVVFISGALVCLFYLTPETGDKTMMDIELEMKQEKDEPCSNDEVKTMKV